MTDSGEAGPARDAHAANQTAENINSGFEAPGVKSATSAQLPRLSSESSPSAAQAARKVLRW